MGKHAHVQIEYHNSEDEPVESLVGFDPTCQEDRQLAHELLDEYLDNYLVPRFRGEKRSVGHTDGFTVGNTIDDH